MEKEIKHDSYVEGLKDGIKAERDDVVEKEFKLSELKEEIGLLQGYIHIEKVKEFIRLLKWNIQENMMIDTKKEFELIMTIDKLSGDL